jgi:hypothetical protein
MFICNRLVFGDLNSAIEYANKYFKDNNVLLGIEEYKY